MSDRKLLEMAAKAAGIKNILWHDSDAGGWVRSLNGHPWWNPLTDDGDALRLAVQLRLQVTPGTYNSEEASAYLSGAAEANERVHFQQDLAAATRRAITRAAAEIGKGMP